MPGTVILLFGPPALAEGQRRCQEPISGTLMQESCFSVPATLFFADPRSLAFIRGWSFLLAQPRVNPVLKLVQGSALLIDRPQRNEGWT